MTDQGRPIQIPMRSRIRKLGQFVHQQSSRAAEYVRWKRAQLAERRFDLKHDLETSTCESEYLQSIDSSSVEFAIPYEPIQYDVFRRMMNDLSRLVPDYQKYRFIDLGSGKGRALLYAAEWDFRTCVGVEFSSKLHSSAEKNIAAYQKTHGRSTSFELHCLDAREFTLPRINLVLFLYNPFTGDVMRSVVDGIESLISANHLDIIVLYRNPTCSDLFKSDYFMQLASNPSYDIYRSRAAVIA